MEALREIGMIVAGILLRIGVPVGITALLAWLLRRLDERWQRQAASEKVGITRLRPASMAEPCWETKDCPPEKREGCPAYAEPTTPCWQVFRGKNRLLRESCLGCGIFRGAPMGQAA